jgi:DNA polymerase-3 subunit epsilon
MKYLNKITSKLIKHPLKINTFKAILGNEDTFYKNIDLEIDFLISNGYPLTFKDDKIYLKTAITPIEQQVFCIVDIETTLSNIQKGQVLEIGAIKYQNGKIIDSYQSLVNTNEISQYVQKLTNINLDMVRNAPSLKTVMEEFKIFLEDDVFVAHDIKFDYNFLSNTMKQFNLGELYNRRLCTIDLAKRVISTNKYGLKHLKKILNINNNLHHRAYDDALSTSIILQKCFDDMPKDIKTTEDLIKFSKSDNLKVIKND